MTTTPQPLFDRTPLRWILDVTEYAADGFPRAVLFTDVLRRRGNRYIDHLRRGQPPVLTFEHDILRDGITAELAL